MRGTTNVDLHTKVYLVPWKTGRTEGNREVADILFFVLESSDCVFLLLILEHSQKHSTNIVSYEAYHSTFVI